MADAAETSRQYWTLGPGRGALRTEPVPRPAEGQALIRTRFSAVSPGTESLVHRGDVPESVHQLMRAPFQLGDLPHPVSHGYLQVGDVVEGPAALIGRTVFTLAGHRDHVVVPAEDCHQVPDGMPARRALLAGPAETALNALWEGGVMLGDRVVVVGGGLIGLTAALLAVRSGPSRLTLVEPDSARRDLASSLGLEVTAPGEAEGDADVVLHSSATEEGLSEALRLVGDDGTLVEQSWYGRRTPEVPLGADFHARRLRIVASQVGAVAQSRRLRRTPRQRLAGALALLDERFDRLLSPAVPLTDLPTLLDRIAEGSAPSTMICPVIDHSL
ncbi:MAG: zinc-binding alcohol dehydrogenase [Nesterenkonia sp.]|uniref:zinc-binding alcohol dehydrogenase n=1 Tax=Nesterenkonia marinintestina TaxID=2979865 RepID=UPI0021BE0470|nr:zinc-binding alcohol dehydrogenase [Nesterenkonia sp. GX14115]MDO5493948.1 zinc-binding alcohol dehydrogenase [Nesterenkonia sp.]